MVPAVGKIGAAAVLFVHGRKVRSLKYFLGTESEHTVPEAEAMALILGLELLKGKRGVQKVSMAADNMGVDEAAVLELAVDHMVGTGA